MIKSVFCLRQPWNYKHYVTVRFVCLTAPHSLWDLNSPHQGLNSGPPRWKGGGLTIGPPGKERKKVKSAQSCPTLCSPMDCSPPGSSVHGIFQARVLEWAFPSSKNTVVDGCSLLQGIFPTQEWNPGLPYCRQILYSLSHQGSLYIINLKLILNIILKHRKTELSTITIPS